MVIEVEAAYLQYEKALYVKIFANCVHQNRAEQHATNKNQAWMEISKIDKNFD